MQIGRLARWRELQFTDPAWLQPGEQRRLATFSTPTRQQQFLAGRWLMREMLARVYGGEPLQQSVDLDDAGASVLPRGHANLSHSGEWILVAQADAPIGIDLERLRPRHDLLGLARMVCSERQCEALAALEGEARLHQFYRWWTLKEAWLKARGLGLDTARMRGLDFIPCAAEEGDSCSALLALSGLALSLHTEPIQVASLPTQLLGEAVAWQFFRSAAEG